jgi:taurine dioxygenase
LTDRARAHDVRHQTNGRRLAAEIRGIDLSQPLGDNIFGEIEHAYNAYGVIFFRNQQITPEQQVAFTRRFR